jgi:hypothetical protein
MIKGPMGHQPARISANRSEWFQLDFELFNWNGFDKNQAVERDATSNLKCRLPPLALQMQIQHPAHESP